jgi:hypothetical protein
VTCHASLGVTIGVTPIEALRYVNKERPVAETLPGTPAHRAESSPAAAASTWAVGWTVFAGIMMTVLGGWWIIAGIIALVEDEFFVVTREWIFQFDLTTWGWIHTTLGVVTVVAGMALFSGAVWARILGVLLSAIAMLIAFAWLPYYPVWALLFITASIAVIWSLTAHGRDVTRV